MLVKSAILDGVVPVFAGLVSAMENAQSLAKVSHETVAEMLGAVGDGRQDRGRLYPVAAVLALAAGAVVCGNTVLHRDRKLGLGRARPLVRVAVPVR